MAAVEYLVVAGGGGGGRLGGGGGAGGLRAGTLTVVNGAITVTVGAGGAGFMAAGAIAALLALDIQTYGRLTHERPVATIQTRPRTTCDSQFGSHEWLM